MAAVHGRCQVVAIGYNMHGVFQNWSAEGPMLSTVRNMLNILDRKVEAVVMLSGFMENGYR